MSSVFKCFAIGSLLLCCSLGARAQAVKVNLPLWLAGSPNAGIEWTMGSQFTVNGEVLWMPYMFKQHEEVFRALVTSVDFRYYIAPPYYYTDDSWDGFYVGPYALYGEFNVGLFKKKAAENFRNAGWGVSGGISTGYKFYLSPRFRVDVNIGIGYAHLQYDKFLLGGEYRDYPLESKITKVWIGPTKFGVHLVYSLFR
ncbi:MAG: DUF3575 domain-containing protein [Odoribacteraceae bacterium]|nr:DUF3575 domain-containing protein [Odoribacteraceae bacterium]